MARDHYPAPQRVQVTLTPALEMRTRICQGRAMMKNNKAFAFQHTINRMRLWALPGLKTSYTHYCAVFPYLCLHNHFTMYSIFPHMCYYCNRNTRSLRENYVGCEIRCDTNHRSSSSTVYIVVNFSWWTRSISRPRTGMPEAGIYIRFSSGLGKFRFEYETQKGMCQWARVSGIRSVS